MIKLSLLNNSEIIVNAELIESIEKTPDTIVTLTTGRKIMVKNNVEEIIKGFIKYRQEINQIIVKAIRKEQ